MDTYMTRRLRGEDVDIDDCIDAWHDGDMTLGNGFVELYEYLGLTRDEYGRFVERASAIEDIVAERKTTHDLIVGNDAALVGRPDAPKCEGRMCVQLAVNYEVDGYLEVVGIHVHGDDEDQIEGVLGLAVCTVQEAIAKRKAGHG